MKEVCSREGIHCDIVGKITSDSGANISVYSSVDKKEKLLEFDLERINRNIPKKSYNLKYIERSIDKYSRVDLKVHPTD